MSPALSGRFRATREPPVVIFKCIYFKVVCFNFYYGNLIDGKCKGLLRSQNLRATDLDPRARDPGLQPLLSSLLIFPELPPNCLLSIIPSVFPV